MHPLSQTRVKICCIQNSAEAQTAVRYGASAVGLVSAMPSGPGVIAEDQIARIAAQVPPGVASFLLTSLQDSAAIIAQQRCCGTSVLQLVDRVAPQVYTDLRAALPGIALIQVIHVTDEAALAEAHRVAPYVNGLLLDSGNPGLPVKILGGTGQTHNWEISRAIRETVDIPIFLAGGLKAENIASAVRAVQPFGVDLCSGVRTDGWLDETKLAAFFRALHAA